MWNQLRMSDDSLFVLFNAMCAYSKTPVNKTSNINRLLILHKNEK